MTYIRRSPIWPDPRVKPPFGAVEVSQEWVDLGLTDAWIANVAPAFNLRTRTFPTLHQAPLVVSLGGSSWSFDGATSSRKVDVSLNAYTDGTGYSVWVRCLTRTGGFTNPLDSDNTSAVRMFQLRFDNAGQLQFIVFNTGVSAFTATGGTTVTNRVDTLAGSVAAGGAVTLYQKAHAGLFGDAPSANSTEEVEMPERG